MLKFSLCIPTMDRYDNFLKNNLPRYIENNFIDEIIITDENGEDIKKIEINHNSDKLILIKNETKLGPFYNKLKACSQAKNEWIALIDSDNFADETYFLIASNYIENNIKEQKNIILAPSKANPNFDYSHLSGLIYKKGNFLKNNEIEKQQIQSYNKHSTTLMNTGNYILNKSLITNLNLTNEINYIPQSSSCDVIYFNVLLFEQLDLNLHVVPKLEYKHIVHNGSTYIQNCDQFRIFANSIHDRYYLLK